GSTTPVSSSRLRPETRPRRRARRYRPSPPMPLGVAPVPDMAGIIGFIGGAIIPRLALALLLVAKAIDLGRAERRAHRHPPKPILQRLQQLLAKPRPRRNRQRGIIGHVVKPMHRSNVRKQKIPHEKALGQPHPPKLSQRCDGHWLFHFLGLIYWEFSPSVRPEPIEPAHTTLGSSDETYGWGWAGMPNEGTRGLALHSISDASALAQRP